MKPPPWFEVALRIGLLLVAFGLGQLIASLGDYTAYVFAAIGATLITAAIFGRKKP